MQVKTCEPCVGLGTGAVQRGRDAKVVQVAVSVPVADTLYIIEQEAADGGDPRIIACATAGETDHHVGRRCQGEAPAPRQAVRN